MRETIRQATAYHEAGHAVAAWRLRIGIKSVSIEAQDCSAGRLHFSSPIDITTLDYDSTDRTRMRVERQIIIALAGPQAQRRYAPRSMRAWHSVGDYETAGSLALWLNGDGETASAYLKWLELSAAKLVASNWWLVDLMARELLERGTLRGKDIRPTIQSAIAAKVAERSKGAVYRLLPVGD